MGPRVPRALVTTLLLAGVFCAPLYTPVYAEDDASSTTASSTEESSVVPETPEESIEESSPLFSVLDTQDTPTPTQAVLLDNSYADIEWNIQTYGGGKYAYFFNGYETLGNPPETTGHTWTSTGDIVSARIKVAPGTTCDQFRWGGTYGIVLWTEQYARSYESDPRYTRDVGDGVCQFTFYTPIPAGTPLIAAFLSLTEASAVMGSINNPGTSTDGTYQNPVAGGFAFQLCGEDGCSGGFGSSTPPTPPGPKISNVLFLPGIKGSRLYKDERVCGEDPGPCTMTLWQPYGTGLAYKLLLNNEGKSLHSVYAREGDIIDEVGGQKFYATFMQEMNAKMASGEYGHNWKWRPIAYDWRLSLTDLISNGTQIGDRIYYDQATSTPYIEQNLRELAASSATGKVTIIAHSNGGLVTKALLLKLGDAETAQLVDKVILVGVPQSGAPQAIGALLFGLGESLPGKAYLPDVLITKELSRQLAENSPMAYHLLPSARYLADTQDPNHSVIGFSGTQAYTVEQTAYGPSIDTTSELYGFLLAQDYGRERPDVNDLTVANILNPDLLSYAQSIHESVDAWVPPSGVELYQIAGWGVDTISGIDFYDEQKLFGMTIGYKRQYRPVFVQNGDGVVPEPSALMTSTASNVHNLWLNLVGSKKDHGDFFELTDLRKYLYSKIYYIEGFSDRITTSAPKLEANSRKLIFQLHSPLTLGIYDTQGNYTGLNKDGSVNENVPGTTYGEFGDVKYVIAPAGTEYELVLNGQADGVFSLDIQEQEASTSTTTTIANVPTTSHTVARLSITNGITDASQLYVDLDGDNNTDIQIAPTAGDTTQYSPVSISESKNTRRTTSSINTNYASSPAAPTPSLIIPSPIAATQKSPPINANDGSRLRNEQVTASTTEQSMANADTQDSYISQTASVYNAMASLTEWIKTLMYNIWKALLAFIIAV